MKTVSFCYVLTIRKFKTIYFYSLILIKYVASALCHSQGFLCDESVASGAERELALERARYFPPWLLWLCRATAKAILSRYFPIRVISYYRSIPFQVNNSNFAPN